MLISPVSTSKALVDEPEVHEVSEVDGNQVVHVVVRTLVEEKRWDSTGNAAGDSFCQIL